MCLFQFFHSLSIIWNNTLTFKKRYPLGSCAPNGLTFIKKKRRRKTCNTNVFFETLIPPASGCGFPHRVQQQHRPLKSKKNGSFVHSFVRIRLYLPTNVLVRLASQHHSPFTTTTTHRLILLSFDFVFLTVFFFLFSFLLEHRTRINDSCRWLAMSARKFPHSICYSNGERDSRSRNGDRKIRSNSFAKGCDCATVWLLLPVAAGCRRLRRSPYLQM